MKRALIALTVVAAVAFPAAAAASVAPGTYTSTVNFANAPSGAHLSNSSTAPSCTVGTDLSVTCTAYAIGGVGHTNATLIFTATYTVTYTCTNGGRQLVVAQGKTVAAPGTPTRLTPDKNGQLSVPATSVDAPATAGDTGSGSPCPNRNWTWTVSSVTLDSYSYTLTFDGFNAPVVSNIQG
jgi:hypothetical protein